MKKCLSMVLCFALMLGLFGCGAQRKAVGTCTLSISVSNLLGHEEELKEEKRSLVPSDGWLLAPVTVEIYEGETAFDVLQRVAREEKIHMEFSRTPLYNSVYVEGIGNLYEFDCGPQSGWMFSVSGVYPNVSASAIAAEDGAVYAWSYTCNRGADLGQEVLP